MGKTSHDLIVLETFLSSQNRSALSGDAAQLYDQAQKLHERLQRPPQVLIAGEFSSGKSTLANILVGAELIPTGVLATHLPVVEFGHGSQGQIQAAWWDGRPDLSFDGEDLDVLLQTDPDFVRIRTLAPLLKQIRVIDTPGTGDPTILMDVVHKVAQQADILVWCTNAVQSWKESERQSWAMLPERIRARSVLLVTHMDLTAVKDSKDRIFGRLEKLVGEAFTAILPFSAPSAEAALKAGAVVDKAAWRESGGAKLTEHLFALAQAAQAETALEAKSFVGDALAKVVSAPTTDAKTDRETPVFLEWRRQTTALLHHLEAGTLSSPERLGATSAALFGALEHAAHDQGTEPATMATLKRAATVSASLLSDDKPDRLLRLLLQVGRDLAHCPDNAT